MAKREYDLLPPEKNGYPTLKSRLTSFLFILFILFALLFIFGRQIINQNQQSNQSQQVSEQDDDWIDDFEADWDD